MSIDTKSSDQHIIDFESRLANSTARGKMEPIDPEREAESVRNTDTSDMVRQVTRRIDNLQSRLNETRGFDPKTGAPSYVIAAGDQRRRAMEIEVHNLQNSVLPYTKAQAAEIEAKKAKLETPEQRLQAEADRQQRLATAAQKRAEEIEIDDMARRILAQRKHVGSA